ncbi:MAG: MFS transporter [Gemmataceae bacterium]
MLAVLRDHTFRSLKHRNYRLYFFGQIVSYTGTWMQSAALMWLVFDRTGDAFWPPLLLVAQVGPTLLLGPFTGALADRRPKLRIVYATQVAFLASAVVLTLLVATNRYDPWAVLALMAVNGLIQSVDLPTRLAFVPDLVPKADLINAVSLNSLLFNSARAVGPALAGGLFLLADWVVASGALVGSRPVVVGAIWCFGLNALSYLAVLAALRRITVPGNPRPAPTAEPASALDGVRYVLGRPPLAVLLALTGLLSVFGWPTLSLFPAYTKLALQHAEKEYSLLVSSLGAGALLAALTTATFGTVGRRRLFLAAGSTLAAGGLAGLTLAESLPTAAASGGLLGFGLILFLATGQSAMQLSVPDERRGRVMALWAMTLSASAPVGHLAAGAAVTAVPVRAVFAGMAAGAGLVAMAAVGLAVGRRRA